MQKHFWRFVKHTADTGTWAKSHAALIVLIPAIGLLGWLFPDPSLQVYIAVCAVLGVLVKHAVLFPVCMRLMDRRQARQHAA